MTSNMTSIEEIVKYQQELLNYQRNQKQIQKETIKLLNSLNNSLTLMSDRLDEFAIKTNMKLDDFNSTPTNSNAILINNASSSASGMLNSNKSVNNNNQMINASGGNNTNKINYLLNNNEIIYLTGDVLTTTTSNSGTNLMNTSGSKQAASNKNDVFILNDLNTLNPSLINLDQLTATSAHQNKIFFINNNGTGNDLIRPLIKLDNATICNGTSLSNLPTTVTTTTVSSGGGGINTSKLNSTSNQTSDDSISGEMSYDESSNNEIEKESVTNSKKKPRKNHRNRDESGLRCSVKDTEEGTNQQRLFNKFVREKVENRLGKDFLLLHEIQEINGDIMEEIKKEALEAYPPINIRPRRAWHLAKASLRCRRRSLRRQKERSDRTSRTVVHSVSTSAVSSSAVSSMSPLTPTATSTTGGNGATSSTGSSNTGAQSNGAGKEEKINLIEPSLIQPQHLTNLSAV